MDNVTVNRGQHHPGSGGGGGGSFFKKHKGATIAGAIGGAILLLTHRGHNAASTSGTTGDPNDPNNPQATLVPVAVPSSTSDGTAPPSVAGDYNPTYVSGPVTGSSIGGGTGTGNLNTGDSAPTNTDTPTDTSNPGTTTPPTPGSTTDKDKSIDKSSVKDSSGPPPPSSKGPGPDKSIDKSSVKGPKAAPNKGAFAGHGGSTGHAPVGQTHTISGHTFPGATGSAQTGQTPTSTHHAVNYPGGVKHVEIFHAGPKTGQIASVPKTPAEQRHTQTPPRPAAAIHTTATVRAIPAPRAVKKK